MSQRPGPRLSEDFKVASKPTSSYDRYKASLHAIFDGKAPLPKHLQEGLGTNDDTPSSVMEEARSETPVPAKKRRLQSSQKSLLGSLLHKIQEATTKSEITLAIDALQAGGFELPNEEHYLSKALSHSSVNIQQGALLCLEGLLESDKIMNVRLLKQRLDNLELATSDRHISALCMQLKSQLS